ncbi:MAG: hypothetical protein RR318_06605 [Alistipes sp.]
MSTFRITSLLLLCVLFAGCSDDDETPHFVPQQLIRQIRIVEADRTQQFDFKYDERQRVRQHIETKVEGSTLSCETFEYTYAINRIHIDRSGGIAPAHYTLYTNKEGYITSILLDNKEIATLDYNINGYYYEKPSTETWASYEYRMIGDQCNLDKITKYNAGTPIDQQSKSMEVTISYGAVPNTTVFDLSYFLLGSYTNTSTQQLPLALFGWTGKRSFMMPTAMQATTYNPSTARAWSYTYETNTDGFITQIHETERDNQTVAREYTVTYQ